MTNVDHKLEIVRSLGVGGMATVYLARIGQGAESRYVAVKKLHAFVAEDPASVVILEDEAQLAAQICHPNVVRVIDFVPGSEASESPTLVMEWIDGVDLGALVRAAEKLGRRLPIDVVAAIARDLLSGLHAAHECCRADGSALDIVHRDVSPQNVLVGFDGIVRVTDFGVAKAKWRRQHTEQGSIKGKLGYLAPEQLAGRCDRRSDVFSAGVVLWELLTGKRMRSSEGVQVLVEILRGRVPAPGTVAPEAVCLDTVIMRALEHSEEDRFATAEEMLQAIGQHVNVASSQRVAAVVRTIMGIAEPVRAEKLESIPAPAPSGVRMVAQRRASEPRLSAVFRAVNPVAAGLAAQEAPIDRRLAAEIERRLAAVQTAASYRRSRTG